MNNYRRILLAEDNARDIELTMEALSEHKLSNQIDIVRDGVEVMDYLHCKGKYKDRDPVLPVVILLDNKMPRMNGLEVLQAIRSDPDLKVVPVVMLTSSRESPDVKTSYELGVNAYVVKPVEFIEFVEVIKQLGIFWALLNEPPL